MKLPYTLICGLALVLAIRVPSMPADGGQQREMLAVVSSLSGSATVLVPPEPEKALQLFDWLPSGSVISVAGHSQLTLAYLDGTRYEIGEKSKVTVSPKQPQRHSGSVRPLAPVPPMPRFAPISAGSRPGARSGAIRMRGERTLRIGGLYPHAESSSLPDSTMLIFLPVPGVAHYGVRLADDSGRTIFETETQAAQISVPAGLLFPGAHYYWEVWTLGQVSPMAMGDGEFVTLPADDIERRAAFKAKLQGKGDAESLALLAEVDRRIGLLLEARGEFRAALAKSPPDSAIPGILEEIEKAIAGPLVRH